MIRTADLRSIARARLIDAEALLRARRYDTASYLCGYAVEVALKYRICRTLRWDGYPETASEFQRFQSFRTHDLRVLLTLSGKEKAMARDLVDEWSKVADWNPEARYKPADGTSRDQALSSFSPRLGISWSGYDFTGDRREEAGPRRRRDRP